ncbi:peroxidase 51 [Dendrobium catenatum]|uniref:Peroxidase n=1 Tax=Dendrobium catenatum TaxID=906689 RepID=A0A2I0WHA3_9ASPA|nr:peroxidase 51 [Dendrobium catenatum]PKU75039.1 Peroxidase 51 [Dendrobium catenatum]
MAKYRNTLLFLTLPSLLLFCVSAENLRRDYYADICPNVENIVRTAVTAKFKETIVTIPGTLRLFAHDCFVQGCDGSILIASTPENTAERDHPDNLSIAGDGFDTVGRAKEAVDAVPQCENKVSCADILVMATRDVVYLAGGPSYEVELGRLDGLSSTSTSVNGKIPQASSNLDQLNAIFGDLGLSQDDMIALSGAHTLGFSHCSNFANRVRNFSKYYPVDPTLNRTYAAQLQELCPTNVDPTLVAPLDPITTLRFDNQYFKNLQMGMGLLTSDQILYEDTRSRPTVNKWAKNSHLSAQRFVIAMTRMGRVGVKTKPGQGNIRRNCFAFN